MKYFLKHQNTLPPASMTLAKERGILGLRNKKEERRAPRIITNTRLTLDMLINRFNRANIKLYRRTPKEKGSVINRTVLLQFTLDFLLFGFIFPDDVKRVHKDDDAKRVHKDDDAKRVHKDDDVKKESKNEDDTCEFVLKLDLDVFKEATIYEYRKCLTDNSHKINTRENRAKTKFKKDKMPGIIVPKKSPKAKKLQKLYVPSQRGRSRNRLSAPFQVRRSPSPIRAITQGLREMTLGRSNSQTRVRQNGARKSIRITVPSNSRNRANSHNPPHKR